MNKEKFNQELLEIQLKLAINEWVELEGKRLYQENEDIKNDPSYQPSVAARVKFSKLLNHKYKISQSRRGLKLIYRIIKNVMV